MVGGSLMATDSNSVHDIFISYRRDGGFETAKYLYDCLIRDGYSVTFDIDTLRGGRFDEALLSRIDECTDFIVILSERCFDKTLDATCLPDNDWMRREIAHALTSKKNIVPIMLSGFNEFPKDLPQDICEISKWNGPKYVREYIDDFYRKLKERFLKSKPHMQPQECGKRRWEKVEAATPQMPVLGKAVDEVTLTGLSGKDADHFRKAMGYYRVLRRRSALKELQAIEKQGDSIVRYYISRFYYELDGTVSDLEFDDACRVARELGCTDAMVAFAEKHLLDDASSFDPVSSTECIDWIRKAITKGNVDALLELGVAYESGKGVDKDIVLAREIFKKSASENCMSGMLAYGFDLAGGRLGTKDLSAAKKILRPVIDHLMKYEDELTSNEFAYLALYHLLSLEEREDDGKVKKYCKLAVESKGRMICDGLTVREHIYWFLGNIALQEDDESVAIKYFKQASQIGVNGLGELGLASCYENGYGVPQDEKKARDYYQIASDKGNGEAQRILALSYLEENNQNEERGKALLKMAADEGDAIAEHVYGMFLISGLHFDKNVAEGMMWLEKAAVQDCDADAMNSLGEQYRDGNDAVEVNSEKAFYWFRRGAEAGSANAMESLGRAYLCGDGTIPDAEEAEKWLIKSAENGNSSAMCSLGTRFFNGDFGEKDVAKAIEWWMKAAEHEDGGDCTAMCNLGTIYRDGDDGIAKNLDKAVEWLTRAVDAGNGDAACLLGTGYYNGAFDKPDMKKALKWWQKAAKLGSATAMNNIGEMYRNGDVGEVDFGIAIYWFKQAANCEPPNSVAMYNLGEMYLEGKGVEKDVKEAEKWYCKAADTCDPDAEVVLGTKYYTGDFGEPNYKEAKKWWERASEHGNSTAMFNLAISYRNGYLGENDVGQWIYWVERSIEEGNAEAMEEYAIYLLENGEEEKCRGLLERSAENGNSSAMCSLGTRFFNGDFGEKDVTKAMEWWIKAAEHYDGGDSIAMLNLGKIYLDGGDGVEKNLDQAVEWLTRAADTGNGEGCCLLGLHCLSVLGKNVDSYEQFTESVTEAFDDERAKTMAIRKAKRMFNKAIESGDSRSVATGHLFLARIANLQGDEETSKAHYAKAAELGVKEEHTSSVFARILDSVSFFKRKSK